MEEVKLNVMLVGVGKQGKNATRETILNRWLREEKKVDLGLSFQKYDKYIVGVVGAPSLVYNAQNAVAASAKDMDRAFSMCFGGVDAFLFVFRFNTCFTSEEIWTLETLKQIFGPSFLDHVIVVMTFGDFFQSAIKANKPSISFHEWCKTQTGYLHKLYEDCNGRFVLINNKEKYANTQQQVLEILKITHEIQTHNGRYTSQCFKAAEAGREKLILEHRAPQLIREIQIKISLLTAEMEAYSEHPSQSAEEKIRKRVQALRKEIEVQDKGYGVLQGMRQLAQKVDEEFTKKVEEEQKKNFGEEQVKNFEEELNRRVEEELKKKFQEELAKKVDEELAKKGQR